MVLGRQVIPIFSVILLPYGREVCYMMSSQEIQAEADKLKKEACDLLGNITETDCTRVVECIISAAMLNITAVQAQAMEVARDNKG